MKGKNKLIFYLAIFLLFLSSLFVFGKKKIFIKNEELKEEKVAPKALLTLPPLEIPKDLKPPKINASGFLVVDMNSSQILAQKDMKTPFPIASITKLITAIFAIENLPLDKEVLITKEILEAYGATPIMKEGDKIKIKDLLYPLLIESSNDAAEAIGSFLGREKAVRLMNQIAKKISMENTTLFDTSGFDPKNVASAEDLFYLGKYLLTSRPEILRITRGEVPENLSPEKFSPQDFVNRNIFYQNENFVGGKGGYLEEAKYTGIFIFKAKDEHSRERYLIFIVLGADRLKAEASELISWTKENFHLSF